VRQRDSAPAARVIDDGVGGELGPTLERDHRAAGLEEDDLLGRARRAPAEPPVELAGCGEVGHPQRHQADPLFHELTVARHGINANSHRQQWN